MPKLKTHKATVKRFTKTKTGKIMHRKGGQDHFNARESGNVIRNKRRDVSSDKSLAKNVVKMLPYS